MYFLLSFFVCKIKYLLFQKGRKHFISFLGPLYVILFRSLFIISLSHHRGTIIRIRGYSKPVEDDSCLVIALGKADGLSKAQRY